MHNHVWSPWMPWDRNHIYRYCHVQDCKEIEKKEA